MYELCARKKNIHNQGIWVRNIIKIRVYVKIMYTNEM